MAKNIVSLSMLRNSTLFQTKEAAVSGITGSATNDGVIKLARYNEGEGTSAKTKTIFGIFNDGTIGKSGYTLYDFDTNAEATLNALVNLINGNDATEGSFRKAIKDAVEALDYTGTTGVTGQYVKTITEQDGVIIVGFGQVAASEVSFVSGETGIDAATVQAALEALAAKADAITISNDDGSINVTPTNGGTDINVKIKSGEKVLAKDGNAGLYTDIKLSALTVDTGSTVKEEFALVGLSGQQLGNQTIKIYKDSSLKSVALRDEGGKQYLDFTYILNDGSESTVAVDVSKFLTEQEFASGVVSTSGIVHGVVDSDSEKDESNVAFLTVGADGFKVSGIKDAIDTKINKLDVTGDTAESGKYVAAIEETDGIVAVKTRANVSDAPLNGYTKGSDATAVAATDTVNQAVSKLENQIVKAKAAATTKVEKDNAASHLTLSSGTATDGSVTYTIGESDIASNSDLSAETAARKAIDGQNGQTYAANTSSNYISGASSLNDADVKLAAALKAEEDARIVKDDALSGVVSALNASSVADVNKVVTDVTQSAGQITATASNLTGVKLDGLTTGSDAKIAATNTLGEALANIQAQIDAMDKSASAEDGKVVTTVTEADGKVTETKANVKDLQLGGYAKTNNTGDIASGDTVNVALSKLENKAAAITIANADGSINVTTAATGTDINVSIKSGEHVLAKDGNAGLYTNIALSSITPSSTTVKEEYQLTATDGTKLGDTIKIYKDSSIVSIQLVDEDPTQEPVKQGQFLKYTYVDASGNTQAVYVDVSVLLVEAEFASGVTANSAGIVTGVVDPTSETFLTVGADGFKLSGVQAAIDAAQASATTEVALKTGENVLELSADTTAADGHVKYILNTKDVASATLLADTISGAGLNADGSYAQNANAKYIATASSLADADDKLDAALFALSGKVGDVGVSGQNAIAVAEGTPGNKHYTVSLTLKKPADVTDNLLSQDANGLTYDPILDCGTYA